MSQKFCYISNLKKIEIDKVNYKIAIIGLGYVGLPLAVEFVKNLM